MQPIVEVSIAPAGPTSVLRRCAMPGVAGAPAPPTADGAAASSEADEVPKCAKCDLSCKGIKWQMRGHKASAQQVWCNPCVNNYGSLQRRWRKSKALKSWWQAKSASQQTTWYQEPCLVPAALCCGFTWLSSLLRCALSWPTLRAWPLVWFDLSCPPRQVKLAGHQHSTIVDSLCYHLSPSSSLGDHAPQQSLSSAFSAMGASPQVITKFRFR